MKLNLKYVFGIFATLFLLAIVTDTSYALRCGTRLVSEGDTRGEVRHKCGEPDYIESWEEERISRDFSSGFRYYDDRERRNQENRVPLYVKEHVKIEEWTYNLGSTRFIRYLRFENGILIDIVTGGYGY